MSIGEACATSRRRRLPPEEVDTPTGPRTSPPRWHGDPVLRLALAVMYGWRAVALTPSEPDRVVHGVALLACGHELRFQVSEREFAAAEPSSAELAGAIDRAVSAAERCYCVQTARRCLPRIS